MMAMVGADRLVEYDWYVAGQGDPRTNGLGHKVITSNGKREVLVPEKVSSSSSPSSSPSSSL